MLSKNNKTTLSSQPELSILMIAYNVEGFIRQALDSALMQKTDFDYEIVIGEDCSTDSTRDILIEYEKKHPDKIRLILREQNLGMNRNFVATLGECRGRYIALLDGDDYWTCDDKLQKQIDFLRSHPDYSVSFHNTYVVYEDGSAEKHPFHMREPEFFHSRRKPKATSSVEDLVTGNFMQTCSVMFRSGLFGELPEWYLEFPTFDWPLHILNAKHGKVGYIDEIMGAYRVHSGGFWSMNMSRYDKPDDLMMMINAYNIINRHFNYKYNGKIRERLASLYYRVTCLFSEMRRHGEACIYARRSLLMLPLRFRAEPKYRQRQKHLIKMMVKGYSNQVQELLRPAR